MAKKKYDLTNESASKKNLTSLVDANLQKESRLLQNLIQEVVEANRKVKESHKKRLEETDEKLRILNAEIDRLKEEINQKDQETTIAQLTYLLDSKDRIFRALSDMRARFTETFLSRNREETGEALKERLLSVLSEKAEESPDGDVFLQSFRSASLEFIEEVFKKSETYFCRHYLEKSRTEHILELFDNQSKALAEAFDDFLPALEELVSERLHMLRTEDDEETLDERVKRTHEERKAELAEEEKRLKNELKNAMEAFDERRENLEQTILDDLQKRHEKHLSAEKDQKKVIEQQLKELKLKIVAAEKKGAKEELKELWADYAKKERAASSFREKKIEERTQKRLGPEFKTIEKERFQAEKAYLEKLHDLRFEKTREDIRFSESQEIFKLQEDEKALRHDLAFNAEFVKTMEKRFHAFEQFIRGVVDFIAAFHDLLADKHEAYLKEEIALLEKLKPLRKSFKRAQFDLAEKLRLRHFSQRETAARIEHTIREHALRVQHRQKLDNIDKSLTDIKKTSTIERLNAEEQAKSELIYQKALIDLADKEHELQLLKIDSLYDSEMNLTKAQTERLNIGQNVNEAMVGTTIESQIHFAEQQIDFAENEYHLRLENIDKAFQKELEYAEEKLATHRQKYLSDIRELEEERDDKLEDISYRLALFTDEKDRRRLKEREEIIKAEYGEKIAGIRAKEENDPYVQRYKRQLEAAQERADKAREDAKKLRDRTKETFETMLETNREKLEQFKKKDTAEHSLAPYIEKEAGKTAKMRHEEALKEAKETYEEKIAGPRQRIEELQATLERLQKEEGEKPERVEIEEETARIEAQREQALTEEKSRYEKIMAEIHEERDAFVKKTESLRGELDKDGLDTGKETLEKHLKNHIADLQKTQRDIRKRQLAELEEALEERKKRLKNMQAELDSHIRPALKGYTEFVKRVASSQHIKEKKAKRNIEREKRKALKDLKARYKS